MLCKSMDWCLYEKDLRHEIVKYSSSVSSASISAAVCIIVIKTIVKASDGSSYYF